MARRTIPAEPEVLSPVMERHIRALRFWHRQDYFNWCREVGVEVSLDKSSANRRAELELIKATQQAQLSALSNPRKFLKQACAGDLVPTTVTRRGWREVAVAVTKAAKTIETRKSLETFLLHLEKNTDLVFESAQMGAHSYPYIDGLVRLHARKALWLRNPLEWKPRSHNTNRQFSTLAHHLMARYEVPAFMGAAWLRSEKGAHRYRDWYVHMGRGHNIRTAKTLYPMTKAIAHHFTNAPEDLTIEGALIFADVKSLNGGRRLVNALMGSRLGQSVERDEEKRAFWLSVYRFLIANPMLDLRHTGPIIDFLANQKFETHELMIGPGEIEVRPPPQPNLTMSRRTPDSLLRQVEAWHGELRIMRANERRFWRPSGIPGLQLRTGPKDRPEEHIHWRIRELLTDKDLFEEGRRLRHCVGSYSSSCASGAMSVWSMERRRGEHSRVEAALTIAVDAKRVVIEARGLANRWANDQEKLVLDTWIKKGELKAGPYLHSAW